MQTELEQLERIRQFRLEGIKYFLEQYFNTYYKDGKLISSDQNISLNREMIDDLYITITNWEGHKPWDETPESVKFIITEYGRSSSMTKVDEDVILSQNQAQEIVCHYLELEYNFVTKES
jgi:hypothetical protein